MSTADATLRMILLGEDRSASKALKSVGGEADKTSTKMDKFHKVGRAAGAGLAIGLAAAGAAAVSFTKKAAEDQQSASRLAQTLQKATGATRGQVAANEDWITAQGKAYGVADDDLRPAISKLAVATGSLTKAQKLASLAMNVSAGTGKSLESVSFALAKAQNGNVTGLSRLGVATKDAAGKTLSLDTITKNLANTYGGAAARNAETAAGKQKILTVQMNELQEKIGYALIPAMQKLTDVGLKLTSWISEHTKLVGILVVVIGTLVTVTWAVSAATKAWAAITKIVTAGQWLLNAALDANPIGLIVIAIAALVVGLVIAYKHSEKFRAIVQGAFHAVQKAAAFAFSWVKDHWKLLLAILGGPIVAATILIISHWGKIKAATSAVWSAIKSIVKGAWDAITGAVRNGASKVLDLIRNVAGGILRLDSLFVNAGKALIEALFRGIIGAARAGMGFVSDLVGAIKSSINSALHLPLSVNFDKGPLHIHATVIPALAKGGIVTRPTMALIGEAGPEAVIPLSGRNAGQGLGGGDVHITINGALDPTATAKQVQKILLTLKRNNGGRALGLA